MFRNEVGLQVLEAGDVVKVGNGVTRYTVQGSVSDSIIVVTSHNTGKSTSQRRDRLSLVTDVRTTEGWKELTKTLGLEEEPETLDNSTRALSDHDTEPVMETSAYAKAVLFALNKLQKHVYGGTVRKNVKAKRRSLGRRQKASRKANR